MRISSLFLITSLGCTMAGWANAAPDAAGPATPTAATPATPAPTPVAPAVVKAAPAKPDPSTQIVCKREEVTGSRLSGPRECHTRAEWAQINSSSATKFNMINAPGMMPTQVATQAGN